MIFFFKCYLFFFSTLCFTAYVETKLTSDKPTYTVIVYMAARNDLFPFAGRNIKQMQQIGSNENIKIFIHFDMHKSGGQKITKRFLVEKNKVVPIGPELSMDSGDINSLIDCVKCAHEKYPSDELVLILWNHGTGPLEPEIQKSINPSELFRYNTKTRLIELDRTIGFIEYMSRPRKRGICFDDITGNYLTNQQLKEGLHYISTNILKKKIAILSCDACSMAGADVFIPFKDDVEYFIASQEVELGTGYNYASVFEPFIFKSLSKEAFARHFVASYKDTYSKITHDYTHSAIDLSQVHLIEENIDMLSKALIKGLDMQENRSVYEAIRKAKHKDFCTRFNEPTYLDVSHLLTNLLHTITKCVLQTPDETKAWKTDITELINQGLNIINTTVIANVVGKNLQYAKGISIYFPEIIIHKSYYTNDFALKTNWLKFLKRYLELETL